MLLLFLPMTSYSQSDSGADSASDFGLQYILEPYLGYEMGYLTQKSVPEMTAQGLNFGGRLGVRLFGVGFGFDYMTSTQTAKQSEQTGDFKPTDYGLFLGHKFESGISIYGTYFLSARAKIQSDVNNQDFSGSGYKLGMGWKLFSFCEIGLELISRKYTKYDQASMTNSLLSSTAAISIAIPLL
ncbi:MAG: hypothetical protein K2X47_11010 [Bdellovibrionales bacterium]|nr:hypothetical protein [Bdellovibrionales bacterium]